VEGAPIPRNRVSDDDSVDNPSAFARKTMDREFLRYAKFHSIADQAKLLREEACNVNRERSECYVGQIKSPDLVDI